LHKLKYYVVNVNSHKQFCGNISSQVYRVKKSVQMTDQTEKQVND